MNRGFIIDPNETAEYNFIRMIHCNLYPNDSPPLNDKNFRFDQPHYKKINIVVTGSGAEFDPETMTTKAYLIISPKYLNKQETRKIYYDGAGIDYWLNGTEVIEISASDTKETVKAKIDALVKVPTDEYKLGDYPEEHVPGTEFEIDLHPDFPREQIQLYILSGKIKAKMV